MSNNFDITIYDFENICRTCFSRENLKPLYEKCFPSVCLVDMLRSITFVQFTEDENLPEKICTNCIYEIKQAFSFVKRCETTDTILRNCVNKIETELSQSPRVEQINKTDEVKQEGKVKIEMKSEIILPYKHRTVNEVLKDFTSVKEIKQEELIIENEYDDEDQDEVDEDHDETYSDNPGYNLRLRSTNSPVEEESSEDDTPLAKILDLLKAREEEKAKSGRDFQYTKCDRSFRSKSLLQQHSIIGGKKMFWCSVDVVGDLKKHKLIHTAEKQILCSICSKTFTRTANLKDHMRIHSGEKPYTCGVCGKTFSRKWYLIRHERTHTREKPNVCSVCSKSFTQPNHLKCHMRTHTGEKLYSCGVCSKAFNRSDDFKMHMRKHTGEKPYSCAVCSKAFIASAKHKNHMRTHTGEKPYSCSVCSKTFTYAGNVKVHMRTHTGEKPYSCEVCNKAFIESNSLKVHMRTHTGEKPFSCGVCGKSFSTIYLFSVHKQTHAEQT